MPQYGNGGMVREINGSGSAGVNQAVLMDVRDGFAGS